MRISNHQLVNSLAQNLSRKQVDVDAAREQISSGKRINSPSDDPAHAGRLEALSQSLSQLDQYDRNATMAEGRLALQESTLGSVNDLLLRARDLAIQANNDTLSESDYQSVLVEVELLHEEALQLANSRDDQGQYLFGGSRSNTTPFTGNPSVQYNGGHDAQSVTVGLGREIRYDDTGEQVFSRIREGNGDFAVSAGAANTGTGKIAAGSVTDRANFTPRNLQVQFTSPNSFDIIDIDSGSALQSGLAYPADAELQVAGMSTVITGAPEAGDAFDITPARNKDVFAIIDGFAEALRTRPSTPAESAQRSQGLSRFLGEADQALDHVNSQRASVGTRLKSIDAARAENSSIAVELKTVRSGMEDIDMVKAITQLENQMNAMEVLQKTYVRIGNLSLFNLL